MLSSFLWFGLTTTDTQTKKGPLNEFQMRDFQEIQIGSQIWSRENLQVSTFQNGDPIPEAQTAEQWVKLGREGKPACCQVIQKTEGKLTFGKLYNWHAVNDSRGLSPQNWHIPSDEEWMALIQMAGGRQKAGLILKFTSGWHQNGHGNDSLQFSALPAGARSFDGKFEDYGKRAYWWSATEYDMDDAWVFQLDYEGGFAGSGNITKNMGYSVRCVKNQ